MDLNQYEIVLVNLDPTRGSEIKKTRPCLVISPNELNRNLRTIIIAPMTTTSKPYPTRVKLIVQEKEGYAVFDQIRTVDKSRIIKSFGSISRKEIQKCKEVIRETLVD